MVKRLLTFTLCMAVIFSSFVVPAYADGGSGNIDHGGGSGMGEGGESWWNGDDGVRVTVIRSSDNKPVSIPVDFTNYNETNIQYYFGRKSKLHYRNNSLLQGYTGAYKSVRPAVSLPTIITDVGTSNISAIRSYFTDRRIIMYIAQTIGTSYDKLTNGRYKLLLEPIAYFFFHGHKFAMTATEAAMYDRLGNGSLRAEMVSLTHQQLPLSMFLQQADLGYPAFNGNRSGKQSDSTIISQLGLGVVKFRNDSDVPTDSRGTDRVEYRCDTDVFTSVSLSSDVELNSNNPASVTFNITAVISQYCFQYGISGYENLVLAIMQQESGGNGKDPMQASECGYNTRFPHTPNSITDPNYSIQCGVEQLASCIKAANCKSPSDMPGISLALQGYNFGNGFIPWAIGHGGYSLANAQSFSRMEAAKLGWTSYGDVNYVSHVLKYYSSGAGGSTFRYPIETGKYTITSGYGQRENEFHKGIDLAAPAGTPIYAAANGTVAYSQYGVQPYGGYGNIVIIRHSSSLISMYGHCSKLLVSVGQSVQKGQEIALVGSTGNSTGNHCHFEIRLNDKSVNPMSYLK